MNQTKIGPLKGLMKLINCSGETEPKKREGTNNWYQEWKEKQQYRSCIHLKIRGYYEQTNSIKIQMKQKVSQTSYIVLRHRMSFFGDWKQHKDTCWHRCFSVWYWNPSHVAGKEAYDLEMKK